MKEACTKEKKAKDLWKMGHSIALINGVIIGALDPDEPAEQKKEIVDRNIRHLRQMVAKDDWDDEDFTDANLAIEAGSNYTAS